MEKTFKVINDLEKEGIIKNYALGGATALLFYAEPRNTWDIDIFIFLPETKELIDLSPLYQSLKKKGYGPEGESIMIEGIPVQFLVPPTPLVEEAVRLAEIKDYQGTQIKVIGMEYLLAIMLETNRPKDRERIAGLMEEKIKIDSNKLGKILARHNLKKKWEKTVEKSK